MVIGFIENDNNGDVILQETAQFRSASKVREIFTIIKYIYIDFSTLNNCGKSQKRYGRSNPGTAHNLAILFEND